MRKVVSGAAACMVIGTMAGCAAPPTDARPTRSATASINQLRAKPKETALDLASRLDCSSTRDIAQDVAVFAASHGVDCSVGDDQAFVRVYADEGTMKQALVDWLPTSSKSRPVVWADAWFAIGPRKAIAPLARLRGTHVVSSVTQGPTPPLQTRAASERDSCVQFVAGFFRDRLLDPKQFAMNRIPYEGLFPGLGKFVAGTVTDADAVKAKKLEAGPFDSEAYLASFGPAIVDFCAEQKLPS